MQLNKIIPLISVLILSAISVSAQKIMLDGKSDEYCTGMYSKIDWGGPESPFIKVDLQSFGHPNPATNNASVSLIIFEYKDIGFLGKMDPQSGRHRYICDESLINEGLCSSDQLYQFIVDDNSSTSYAPIKTTVLTDIGTNDFSYRVTKTGYYCIAAFNPPFDSSTNDFKMIVSFHNAFGNLPASEIPMLPLYGLLAVIYAVCLCVYLFQVYRHRSELLLLQKYLAGFFVFLTIENILIWSLFDVQNNNKKFPIPGGIQFYVIFISCLNSFKVSFSLFLLLIISLGYGIVYPKLPRKTMNICKILAVIHFFCLLAFTWLSYYTTQAQPNTSTTDTSKTTNKFDSNSWVVVVVTVPLAVIFAVLYLMILNNLKKTTTLLQENKQVVKLKMYRNLFRLIFASMLLLIFAFIIISVLLFNDSLTESIERFWKFNDVLTTFWPACIYFVVFVGIAIIWRPTDSSYLLAASTQIPTTENNASNADNAMNLEQFGNEFEFDDLRSLESDGNPFQDPESTPATKVQTTASNANPFDDRNKLDDPFDDKHEVDLDKQLEAEKLKLQNSDNADHFELDDDDEDDDEQDSPKNKKD